MEVTITLELCRIVAACGFGISAVILFIACYRDSALLAKVSGIGMGVLLTVLLVLTIAARPSSYDRLEEVHPKWAELCRLCRGYTGSLESLAMNRFAAENEGCPTNLTMDEYRLIWNKVNPDNEALLEKLYGECVVLERTEKENVGSNNSN